jgi:hypothetical protein
MFTLTITFPQGPTIMDDDQKPVVITRVENTQERVAKLHAAALLLGAIQVTVAQPER